MRFYTSSVCVCVYCWLKSRGREKPTMLRLFEKVHLLQRLPSWKFPCLLRRKRNISDKANSSAFFVTLIMPLMGAKQKTRRQKMSKHASTSNYIGNDGGGKCGGAPLLLPCRLPLPPSTAPLPPLPSPCSLPLLCTPSLL